MKRDVLSIEHLLKRDRVIVGLGLLGISALSWIYLLKIADGSGAEINACCSTPYMHSWSVSVLILVFMMWTVMMAAMMLPSVSPMILMVAAISRGRTEHRPFEATGAFLAGYLAAWTGFSAIAALVQWVLHAAGFLSALMAINNRMLEGVLLFAAGAFQWTSLKDACLTRCRSPLGFLINEWRDGIRGAIFMGLKHGIYCIGCCWLLMALMFVVGTMNLLWMAMLTVFVLLEKISPGGLLVSRTAGLFLISWGLVMMWR